jgi:3-oxoadipate enol-lactonase
VASPIPAPTSTGYVDVEDAKLYYEVFGQGHPVVLIHDGLLDCRAWDFQLKAFVENYQVIRYDRRFYGRSEASEVPYSNVEDLHALLQYLNIKTAALVGISAGGGLAIDFTLAYPAMVDTLMLVGAVVSGFDYSAHFQARNAVNGGDFEAWLADPYLIASDNAAARQHAANILR